MKFSKLHSMISRTWTRANGHKMAYLVLGKPGGGKSALARSIVRSLGGTDDNTVEFTPSLRDPVDVMGTPNNRASDGSPADYTEWVPPKEFYKLRAGVGKCFLIIEELTDSSVAMMNAMCRIVLDRMAGDLKLSDQLYIIGTGNRTEDKSGANRLTSKLGNRLNVQHFDENLDDWVDWAINNNIDPVLIQFIRFKPNLLSDFDPNRPYGVNPTPRQWEAVNICDPSAPTDEYFEDIKGLVGDGAAAEFAAFRKIYAGLISFEEVVMNPTTVKIPSDLSAQYAIVGSVSHNTNPQNIERVAQFVERLPSDFGVMFWQDTTKRTPAIKTTKPFIKWATSAGNVVLN